MMAKQPTYKELFRGGTIAHHAPPRSNGGK